MISSPTRRVLAIASGGGHWVQMQRIRPAFAGFDVAYVSVYPDYADDLDGARYYVVPDVSRASLGRLLVLVARFVAILIRERPHVVITTGSFPGLVGIAIAKTLMRARTIWIDSIANC